LKNVFLIAQSQKVSLSLYWHNYQRQGNANNGSLLLFPESCSCSLTSCHWQALLAATFDAYSAGGRQAGSLSQKYYIIIQPRRRTQPAPRRFRVFDDPVYEYVSIN